MFFEEICEPRFDDYDEKGDLSPAAILKIIEDAGMHHTESVKDKVADPESAWVLLEWRLEIERQARINEKLHLRTWVHGKGPASAIDRDFLATDEAGNVFFRASGRFVVVDLTANRLKRISAEQFAFYDPETETAFAEPAPHLRECAEYAAEASISLRRSDIDVNGHVHNTCYVDLALNALPENVYRDGKVSSLRILYRQSVKLGDEAVIRSAESDGRWRFGIYAGGRACTVIEMKL